MREARKLGRLQGPGLGLRPASGRASLPLDLRTAAAMGQQSGPVACSIDLASMEPGVHALHLRGSPGLVVSMQPRATHITCDIWPTVLVGVSCVS
jgi:hypothetical protein